MILARSVRPDTVFVPERFAFPDQFQLPARTLFGDRSNPNILARTVQSDTVFVPELYWCTGRSNQCTESFLSTILWTSETDTETIRLASLKDTILYSTSRKAFCVRIQYSCHPKGYGNVLL